MKYFLLVFFIILLGSCGKPKLHCAKTEFIFMPASSDLLDNNQLQHVSAMLDSLLFSKQVLAGAFHRPASTLNDAQRYRDTVLLVRTDNTTRFTLYVWQKNKEDVLILADSVMHRLSSRLSEIRQHDMAKSGGSGAPVSLKRTGPAVYAGELPLGDPSVHYDAYKCF